MGFQEREGIKAIISGKVSILLVVLFLSEMFIFSQLGQYLIYHSQNISGNIPSHTGQEEELS